MIFLDIMMPGTDGMKKGAEAAKGKTKAEAQKAIENTGRKMQNMLLFTELSKEACFDFIIS